MQSISDSVYIEDHYLGATLGVIQQPRGLVQVDAPPAPEDGRAWRAALMGLGSGPERVLDRPRRASRPLLQARLGQSRQTAGPADRMSTGCIIRRFR